MRSEAPELRSSIMPNPCRRARLDLVDVFTNGVSDGDFTASRTARLNGLAVTARARIPTMSSSTFR